MFDPLNPKSLKPARKLLNLSRGQLAELSGVHETTILRIENGKTDPRLDGTWLPLVRALEGMSPKEAA